MQEGKAVVMSFPCVGSFSFFALNKTLQIFATPLG